MKIFKRIKITRKRAIISGIILLVALGAFFLIKGRGDKELATAQVERGEVAQQLILTGSISADKYVAMSFPTSGKIIWVGVNEGQKVVKGQGLLKLDTTVLNATYQQALNTYKDKEAAAQKAEDDVKDHSADETFTQKATRVAAQVARDNAWDSLLAAKYNLDNATLVAPFSGIVTSLAYSSAGVNVTASQTVVEVIDPSTIYFDVDADQNDVTQIKDGQEVVVVLDSYAESEIKGKVAFIGYTPKSGEVGTVYKVRIEFDKGALGEILPRIGMTGDAKFTLSKKQDVLYVPSGFVNSDIKGRFLKIGKPNNKTYVELGLEGEDRVEILDKVKQGDILYD